jgi:DcmR-like sensory protein
MIAAEVTDWKQLLERAAPGDHYVQIYSDESFLCEAVAQYASAGLRNGECVFLVATPAHRAAFLARLGAEGADAAQNVQLALADAESTLARISAGGVPDWHSFRALFGDLIAKARLEYAGVRAYGEMVDVLWRRGEREIALRLEEFWCDLAGLQTFSLLCAYCIDNLDPVAYRGALDRICKGHSQLIPVRDYKRFNETVVEASEAVLDRPLAQMLLSLAERHRSRTGMPQGQATLLWLQRNMPRTAEKVLAQVRSRYSA